MTFRRMPFLAGLLCVLLLGFAGASYGQVRWSVQGSPTEVINTGRSEVVGSVTFYASNATTTGGAQNGATQIAFVYDQPSMQIDNTTATGIHLFTSPALSGVTILSVENFLLNGRCTGRVTINIPAGLPVSNLIGAVGDFIRLEGVRGRVDMSLAQTPGTDLYVSIQSINNPNAQTFEPDRIRVAKSFDGMSVKITSNSLLLCFPSSGLVSGSQTASIQITESFGRAFVDDDANSFPRVDDDLQPNGDPTNSTEFTVWLSDIPASVSTISWPATVTDTNTGAQLVLTGTPTYSKTTQQAQAVYSYEADNQTNLSDTRIETFTIVPTVTLPSGSSATGVVHAAVTLSPIAEDPPSGCAQPGNTKDGASTDRPRFMEMWESDANDVIQDDDPAVIYSIIRCNCYMLFTYVSANGAFDTGISVANTTGDQEVFGTDNDAPDQSGPVIFYFYDRNTGYAGSYTTTANTAAGRSYVNVLSNILPQVKTPTGGTGITSFEGYVIARADFQFCHAFAFIADKNFGTVAHGYVANIIPDPAIRGGRAAADAADTSNPIPAGESLNN